MQPTNNQTPLANGCQLNHYKIIRQLGKGGFGITYLVLDESLNKPIALKEYFPDVLSFRTSEQMHVSVLSTDKQADFAEGLRRFEREAMMLSEFKHPNIIQVLGLFKANNTAYFAMDYIEGLSLDDYQKQKNRALTEQEIIKQCLPVLNGLKEVHNKGMLHLDIKPDNIIQTKYGQPLLIDFGGARVVTSQHSQDLSKHSSMVATDGYAPTEQYSLIAEQTPATDLYAFGMTLYKLMVPQATLPRSHDRKDQVFDDLPDPLKPLRQVAKGYSEALYQAVEACTQLKQKDRPQSVAALQNILAPLFQAGGGNKPALQVITENTNKTVLTSNDKKLDSSNTANTDKNSSTKKPFKAILVIVILLGLIGGGYQYNQYQIKQAAKNIKISASSAKEQKQRHDAQLAYAKQFPEQLKKGLVVTKDSLMWMRCSLGQTWTGTTCKGEGKAYDWESAYEIAKSKQFAGYSDWRLPSLQELRGLVYCSKGRGGVIGGCLNSGHQEPTKPTINQALFPNTEPGFYWSSSPYALYSNNAWSVYFVNGYGYNDNRNNSHRVRLVRSGQ